MAYDDRNETNKKLLSNHLALISLLGRLQIPLSLIYSQLYVVITLENVSWDNTFMFFASVSYISRTSIASVRLNN